MAAGITLAVVAGGAMGAGIALLYDRGIGVRTGEAFLRAQIETDAAMKNLGTLDHLVAAAQADPALTIRSREDGRYTFDELDGGDRYVRFVESAPGIFHIGPSGGLAAGLGRLPKDYAAVEIDEKRKLTVTFPRLSIRTCSLMVAALPSMIYHFYPTTIAFGQGGMAAPPMQAETAAPRCREHGPLTISVMISN
jgi:hypothetical protein